MEIYEGYLNDAILLEQNTQQLSHDDHPPHPCDLVTDCKIEAKQLLMASINDGGAGTASDGKYRTRTLRCTF